MLSREIELVEQEIYDLKQKLLDLQDQSRNERVSLATKFVNTVNVDLKYFDTEAGIQPTLPSSIDHTELFFEADDILNAIRDGRQPLYDGGLSVPGVIGDIELIERCFCVDNEYDKSLMRPSYQSARKDCSDCQGTGIAITDNGNRILNLIKISTERK